MFHSERFPCLTCIRGQCDCSFYTFCTDCTSTGVVCSLPASLCAGISSLIEESRSYLLVLPGDNISTYPSLSSSRLCLQWGGDA